MAHLIFVPDWLKADIVSSGLNLETIKDDFSSAIVSQLDVKNYHLANINFLKLLLSEEELEHSLDGLYSMYQNVFHHNLPDMPELHLAIKSFYEEPIIWDDFAACSGTADRVKFKTEQSLDGNAIYIIGEHVDRCSSSAVCSEPHAIVRSILATIHNGIRISGKGLDKSVAFRESAFLTDLWLSTNKSFL